MTKFSGLKSEFVYGRSDGRDTIADYLQRDDMQSLIGRTLRDSSSGREYTLQGYDLKDAVATIAYMEGRAGDQTTRLFGELVKDTLVK